MAEDNKLTVKDQGSLTTITADDVRRFFCDKATANEVALFLQIAKVCGLNPFKRELYLVKYGDNPASIVTGYEVYLKRAEANRNWGGFKAWTEGEGEKMVAKVEIYRKDWTIPLTHEVEYAEYCAKKKDGTPTRFWAEKPKTMLKKVAISQGMRLAFPEETGGMPYIEEELATTIDAEVVAEKPQGKPAVDQPKAISDQAELPPIEAGKPLTVTQALQRKTGEKFDVEGVLLGINAKSGTSKAGKPYEITEYAVGEKDQDLEMIVSKFGKAKEGIAQGDQIQLTGILVGEYNGKKQYQAQDLIKVAQV